MDRATFIRTLTDVETVLATASLPEIQRQTLRALRAEHFANGEEYVLTELGLSKWESSRDVEDWAVLRAELLHPDRDQLKAKAFDVKPITGFNWEMRERLPMRQLLQILAGNRGVPGIEDELLIDLRESYALAIAAANIVQDRRALKEEGERLKVKFWLRDDPDEAFAVIYHAKLMRARLTKFTRAIRLPFSLSPDRKLEIDDASAVAVLHMLIRLPLLSRLVEGPDLTAALNQDQLVTGALFPELLPFLQVAPKAPADDFLATWIEPDEYLMKTYSMTVGPQNGFEFAVAHSRVLGPELSKMGLSESISVELSFHRQELANAQPDRLVPVLVLNVNERNEEPAVLMNEELREIERALGPVLSNFRGLDHLRQVRLRRDQRPLAAGYRLELVGGDLATYVHFFEIVSEFSRFETRPRR